MKLQIKAGHGFTLMELLIVMAILAMLAALVGPALFGNLGRGQRSAAQTQMDALATALDTYRLDIGRYPRELEGLIENDTGRDNWQGPYLARAQTIPLDPWGNEYVYRVEGQSFTLMSLGADGAPGGEGDDADIQN